MKIELVNLYHLRMKLQSPFETSFGRIDTRDCILVEIASEGVVGFGECVADRDPGYAYETVGTAWHILQDFLIPLVLGKKIEKPADFFTLAYGVRGHEMAKAGLEMALWDVYGKQQGESLRELLGGSREKVDVGVSVGIKQDVPGLLDTVNGYVEDGYQRVKLKIKPGRDIEETQAVRHAFPALKLQVDANSAYTRQNALDLQALDELDLLLIEQPMAEDDLWDHHWLQKHLQTPICLDESIRAVRHARQALEMEAARVINIKPGRVGGLSQAVLIHDLCQSAGVPVWCGGMLETGVGRASNLAVASLPNFSLPGDISATARYYSHDITEEIFVLNPDSTITVPAGPGLGISIDSDVLERVSLSSVQISL